VWATEIISDCLAVNFVTFDLVDDKTATSTKMGRDVSAVV